MVQAGIGTECPGDYLKRSAAGGQFRQDSIMTTSLVVPRLVAGDRFVLRAWELGDLPLVQEASSDDLIPLITSVPSAYSQEAGEAFVRRQWERASSGSGYPFVIVRVEDGRPVGNVGLWLKDLEAGRASVGYWVAGSARGQGVAADALRVVASWALGDLRIPRLQLYVEPWNVASQRTAERVGFQQEGLLRSWQQVGSERRDMIGYSMIVDDLS
jgi:[ribosomal protein S5]-alanine N-acetyltransferase